MIDLFRILKLDYKEYVILIKNGGFYTCFDEDSIILNKIFGYKILYLKNNIKVGFPNINIDIVREKLEELKINYIVVKDKNIDYVYNDKRNNFKKYTSSVFDFISINSKIEKLCNRLKDINDVNVVDSLLEQIEDIINLNNK